MTGHLNNLLPEKACTICQLALLLYACIPSAGWYDMAASHVPEKFHLLASATL